MRKSRRTEAEQIGDRVILELQRDQGALGQLAEPAVWWEAAESGIEYQIEAYTFRDDGVGETHLIVTVDDGSALGAARPVTRGVILARASDQ